VDVRLAYSQARVASAVLSGRCSVVQAAPDNATMVYTNALSCELGSERCTRAHNATCSASTCAFLDNDPDECGDPLQSSCIGYRALDSGSPLQARMGVWQRCWVYEPNPARTTYSDPAKMLNPATYQLWLSAVIVLSLVGCCLLYMMGRAACRCFKYPSRKWVGWGGGEALLAPPLPNSAPTLHPPACQSMHQVYPPIMCSVLCRALRGIRAPQNIFLGRGQLWV
jgi:hypothetical protein